MPIRQVNAFEDLPSQLKTDVNPYVSELIDSCHSGQLAVLYGPHLKGKAGHWRQHHNKSMAREPKKLVLEIGMHMGKCLNEMALAHPEYGFMGLDITFKRVVSTAKKAKARNLDNLVSILADARCLDQILAKGEIDGALAFFPDPWIKKKSQVGNRLFNADYCKLLSTVIKKDGFFWFKTDCLGYFQQVEQCLDKAGFVKACSIKEPLLEKSYESTFEGLFKSQGLPTYEGVWLNTSLSLD